MSKFKSKAEKKMLADATRGEWYNTVHYIAGNKGVGRLMQCVLNNNKDVTKIMSNNNISR